MELMKRWYRKFVLDVPEEDVKAAIAATTDPEKYAKGGPLVGPYTPEDSDDLTGKVLTFRGDAGVFVFNFKEINKVGFKDGEKDEVDCYAQVKTMDGEVYLVNFLVPGYEWAKQITLIADMKSGCGTIVDAHFGTENSNIDVARDFYFGRFDGDFAGGELHGFTNELIGTAIEWDYGPQIRMKIRHMYTSNLFYTYGAAAPNGAWMATNPANYVKIRDDIFLFTFIEERQAGLQGLFLIDLKNLHDVGCFFGVSKDHMSSSCFGAIGTKADITMTF